MSWDVLDPSGPIGAAERLILFDSLAIMLAIVVPVIATTLAFAWWYRSGNAQAVRLPDWEYSGRLELLVWSIPALTVMFLGGIAWVGSHDLDPAKPIASEVQPLEVQVVSLDWKWLFILPEQGIASVNALTVPVGRPVHFRLTSSSVMNTFFVPRLGSQIYTMNGMVTELNLRADKPGVFRGFSGHFSGDGFSGMRFDLTATDGPGFAAWVAQSRASGRTLDQASYRALAKPSSDVAPFAFARVDPGLFDRVAMQHEPPAPGPQRVVANAPAPGVHPYAPETRR